MRRTTLVVSIVLLVVVGYLWYNVNWAEQLRREHVSNPTALHKVGVDAKGHAIYMTENDLLLQRIAPRSEVGRFRYALLSQLDLYPLEYILLGLAGACIGLWLALAGLRAKDAAPEPDWVTLAVGVLLSGAAGGISYLLVLWGTSIHGDYVTTMHAWKVLPILAGGFYGTFYEAMPGVLKDLLARIGKGREAPHLNPPPAPPGNP